VGAWDRGIDVGVQSRRSSVRLDDVAPVKDPQSGDLFSIAPSKPTCVRVQMAHSGSSWESHASLEGGKQAAPEASPDLAQSR